MKQVKGTILKGDAKDIAREYVGRHEVNVIRAKKCGEMVHCFTAILHVLMALGQFNVILNAKDSNPRWVQCHKACKIEVQLDLYKPDMLLEAIRGGDHLELAKGWPNWWQWLYCPPA